MVGAILRKILCSFEVEGLIAVIPFSAELQRIGETVETVPEDRNRL